MKSKEHKLFIITLLIIVCFSFSTIAYSAINSTMTITGTALARVQTDVRITNFKLSSAANGALSSYEEFTKNTISSSIKLTSTAKTIIYDVEVTNYGTNDVGIYDITGLPSGLTYEIINYNLQDKICDSSGNCNNFIKKTFQIKITGNAGTYDFTLSFDFRKFHKVTYKNFSSSTYPSDVIDGGTLTIEFKENLGDVIVKINDNDFTTFKDVTEYDIYTIKNITGDVSFESKKSILTIVSGDLKTIGSEVCIKEECFYIVESDSTTVTLLSKYNLYVGGQYTTTSGAYIEYGTIATGIQNYNMIGYTDSGAVRKGTIAYSTNSSTYSTSIVKTHVDNYANHLKSLGASVVSAKLLEKTELEKLGCSGTSCTTAPSWVYSTSYWTGTSYDTNNVYYVVSNGYFAKTTYSNNYGYGVRPLVKISLSDAGINNSTITVVSGNLDTPGSEVCIKDECFYVLSSTTTTVKLLAKYNLYLGGVYSNSTYTSYGAGASGIQNVSMVGYIPGLDVRNGVTTFASSNYWYSGGLKAQYGTTFPAYVYDTNATFYEGIENYKNYLINQGTNIAEARLISLEELEEQGCSSDTTDCSKAPKWIYSTSYWTGSAKNNVSLWNIMQDARFSFNAYSSNSTFGVRPVIVAYK